MRGNSLTQERAEAMWLRLTGAPASAPAFAAGGIVPDISCSADSVPAFLQGCDYIIPAALLTRLGEEIGDDDLSPDEVAEASKEARRELAAGEAECRAVRLVPVDEAEDEW